VDAVREAHRQLGYSLRMEWGLAGAEAIGVGCDVALVVDVLSFTTTLTVAADRGTTVFPYPWGATIGLPASPQTTTLPWPLVGRERRPAR